MAAPHGPNPPESPYAAPRSEPEEPYGLGVSVGWAPVAAIAAGVIVSIAWAIYLDLTRYGTILPTSWLRIAAPLVLWGALTWLLVARVSWARAACRGLAALVVVGGVASLWFGGSLLFCMAVGLRSLIFAAVFVLLRRPVDRRPPPLWMQSP
jgi:hypothetical protein